MKVRTFFYKTKQIYTKKLTVSKSTFKIKTMLFGKHFEILLTSAVIYKDFLHENKIVQYL